MTAPAQTRISPRVVGSAGLNQKRSQARYQSRRDSRSSAPPGPGRAAGAGGGALFSV